MSEETQDLEQTDPSLDKDEMDASEGRAGEGRPRSRRRRKVSYLTQNKIEKLDYKDVATLKRFLTDRGKILPARQNGNTAKQQRMLTRAVKQAREMALIPFVVNEAVDTPRRSRTPKE